MIEVKPKIIYFGNKFSHYKSSKSVLETLEPLFAEFVDIKSYSGKKNKVAKLFDMVFHFFAKGLQADKIIIDVYSTSAFYFAFILSSFCILFSKNYILFLHGGNLPSRYTKSKRKIHFIFKRAEYIIAPSNYLKSFFESKGYQIRFIPNIIELNKYPFKLRKLIHPNILALRGFGKPYNPLLTLKAINILKDRILNIKLLLFGNKDEFYYNEVINYIKEHHLESIVSVRDKVNRNEWVRISADYDIMVSNPVIDNTPISVMEAMALGMCVISTNVGGVPYLLTDGYDGLLISNNSVEELVSKIEFILNQEKDFSFISINARKKAEEFSWEKVKPKWQNLLCD